MAKSRPLTISVDKGELCIRIGVDVLAEAFHRNPDNNPFDDSANNFRQTWKINDPYCFAQDVAHELEREEEDGSTMVTRLLDSGCMEAVDQGSEYVDEIYYKPPV